MMGGVWLTPVLQDLNSKRCLLKGRKERGKYHPPPHTHTTHKQYTPTTSNTSSDPTFQMGLSPASFKLLPGVASLHLNSLHTSWIFSPLHSVLLTSETCFSGHQHFGFQINEQFFIDLPSCLHGADLSPNLLPSFSFAVHCVSPLLPFPLCFLYDIESSYIFP